MPIYLDPNQRIRIRLDGDVQAYGDKAPVFLFKPMTGRMAIDLQARTETVNEDNGLAEIFGVLESALDRIESQPGGPEIPKQPLLEMLTPNEALELQNKYFPLAGIGPDDKKKLDSPSKSDPVSSAVTAAINATMPQANNSPASLSAPSAPVGAANIVPVEAGGS